ncbi:MAG: hypothetical protein EA394_01815 [Bacteroidia bacterium]|nr:MAG: hypothetical protein EA394_01815 [Bacteroidia bacterium]
MASIPSNKRLSNPNEEKSKIKYIYVISAKIHKAIRVNYKTNAYVNIKRLYLYFCGKVFFCRSGVFPMQPGQRIQTKRRANIGQLNE